MIRNTIIAIAFFAATCAQACITGPWHSTDKTLHAVGNAAIVLGTDEAVKVIAPETFAEHHHGIKAAPSSKGGA